MKHAPEQTLRAVAATLAVIGLWASETSARGDPAANPATHPTTLCALRWEVKSVLIQPDGKIVIAPSDTINFLMPDLSTIGTFNRTVVRFFPDGSLDFSFGCRATPSCIAYPTHLAQGPDGRVVLNGDFDMVDGQPRHHLALLLPDGKLDESFVPWRGLTEAGMNVMSPRFRQVGFDSNSREIILGGVTHERKFKQLVRLDLTGQVITNQIGARSLHPPETWNSWEPLDSGSPRSTAEAAEALRAYFSKVPLEMSFHGVRLPDGGAILALYDEGRGFCFRKFDKNWRVDLSYSKGVQVNGGSMLALQKDGKLLITGGVRDPADGITSSVTRLNTDGSVDRTLHRVTIGGDAYLWINCLAVQDDGKILIGGRFFEVNGVKARYFARLNPDGSLDEPFQSHFTYIGGLLARQRVLVKRLPTIASSSGTPSTPSTLPVVGMTNVFETIPKGAPISILITSLEIEDGTAVMQFEGASNTHYILQAQNALGSGDWFNVSTNQTDAGGRGELHDPHAEDSSIRFYRVAAP